MSPAMDSNFQNDEEDLSRRHVVFVCYGYLVGYAFERDGFRALM